MCTPLGFVRLFGVVGQVLVKPHLLRDVDSEFDAFNMEEASVRRKLAATKDTDASYGHHPTKNGLAEPLFVKVVQATTTTTTPNGVAVNNTVQINNNSKLYNRVHLQEHKYEASFLHERLREIEADKNELGGWNLFYLFILAYYDGTAFQYDLIYFRQIAFLFIAPTELCVSDRHARPATVDQHHCAARHPEHAGDSDWPEGTPPEHEGECSFNLSFRICTLCII